MKAHLLLLLLFLFITSKKNKISTNDSKITHIPSPNPNFITY